MIQELIDNYPELAPWTTQWGEPVDFIPFSESLQQEQVTHAYALPFVEQNTCIIPRRGDGRWWLAGGTVEGGKGGKKRSSASCSRSWARNFCALSRSALTEPGAKGPSTAS